jgi:predicted transcriptional regulator
VWVDSCVARLVLAPWWAPGWRDYSPCLTLCLMTTITFRTDADVDRALADLGSGGQDRSQVIREAIMTAWRARQAERLRAEAEALAADPDDRAEARQVLSDMESLRAW